MISWNEAIEKVSSEFKNNKIMGLAESNDLYIIALDNGNEGYETVEKETGKRGFMWIWEFMDLMDSGKAKKVNNVFFERAS